MSQEPRNEELDKYRASNLEIKEVPMSCPYFQEGYFGICVASDAVHVPSIAEIETFCFKVFYTSCPNFDTAKGRDTEITYNGVGDQ